ncbi:MAG: bifunctional DNA-formamidopyrimidine glycosylase/DNA-(apurinic or apyrimidinic site) lyase [Acidobacteriota bacterium]|nr:bifunctional DNA-formamidopyrimidine glycosylase/DNA-(apurinic or apyrimidinic site) lyase [Acidobacteriota bacterium]
MPELPEVETIVRQLSPLVSGCVLARVEVLDPRWSAPLSPAALARALGGRRIRSLTRRGKYIVWDLHDGLHLVQHLRMSAVLLYRPDGEPRHVRVRMQLQGGPGEAGGDLGAGPGGGRRGVASLVVCDPRRFGTAQLVHGADELERFFAARLGLEPFDPAFTAEHLRALVRPRRTAIKALLLDQRSVAGVGNIYADEALFRARIHPARGAGGLTLAQCRELRAGLIEALEAGIDARGASIDDFRHVDGVRGTFQERFLVHRRAGERCPRCEGTVEKLVVAGRGTYVCPRCQPAPRRSAARRRRGGGGPPPGRPPARPL